MKRTNLLFVVILLLHIVSCNSDHKDNSCPKEWILGDWGTEDGTIKVSISKMDNNYLLSTTTNGEHKDVIGTCHNGNMLIKGSNGSEEEIIFYAGTIKLPQGWLANADFMGKKIIKMLPINTDFK